MENFFPNKLYFFSTFNVNLLEEINFIYYCKYYYLNYDNYCYLFIFHHKQKENLIFW